MRWGFDGWIYATVGYSRGDIYSGDGKKHFGTVSEGVFRFKPDGSAVEQVASKGGNTWGMDIAPDGELFFTQANGSHVNHVVMPETVLAKAKIDNAVSGLNIEDHKRSYPLMSWTKQAYVQIDWVGNFTAASGCCIYDGGAWPDKYNYTHYVTEPTLNIVHQDILKQQGVTYVASKDHDLEEKEFVAGKDLWFRPIHERVGPDGALYILDFYNQAVVHNDTRGPRHDPRSNAAIRPDRDHYFGRVWRVQHQQAKQINIPRLDGAKPDELVKALEHPNEWVRATAHRLLDERGKTDVVPALQKLAKSSNASASSRIHALWVLNNLGANNKDLLVYSLNSNDPGVRKNAIQIAALSTNGPRDAKVEEALLQRVKDSDGRARLESIIALGNFSDDEKVVKALIGIYPDLNDKWLESAVAGVASQNPESFIAAATDAEKPQEYGSLITQLANEIVATQDAKRAAQLLEVVAGKPAAADSLKAIVLNALVKGLRPENAPEWNSQLQKAFQELLASSNTTLSTVSLPLMARWDKNGALAGDVQGLVQRLVADLNDARKSDDDRAQIAGSLLGVRQLNAEIVPSVAKILGSSSSTELQRRIIESLGALPDADMGNALVSAYPKVNAELQNALVNQLLKRADWSSALVDAIKAGQVNLATLGPVNINRLRTHSDRAVAEKANQVIDELRGPEAKEKNELIAKFTPLVTQPGDATRGHQLFLQNCATCHRLNGEGKDLAPDLTGMGAHGPAELIIHVLDPNRVVEPNFYSYSIETKDGEIYDGIITRENSASVMLRNAAGDTEIKTADIKSRRNTGLSLMPNGFESLGGDNLRDILAYVCAGDANFHLVDLQSAFTASTLNGLFSNIDSKNETLAFKRFGITKVSSIPFDVVNPIKSTSGKNVIVLKGGYGYSKTMPQKVVVEGPGLKANRLHFLSGVGGWAYPWGGDRHLENMPVAKVTVQFADNQNEEFVLKNGLEFADYIGAYDVPGSKAVPGMLSHGQVRWFTKKLKHQDAIKSITLESFDNEVAPVFVAITADSGTGNDAEVETVATPAKVEPLKWDEGKHLLIVGGGSSHDFDRWFKDADSATLVEKGKVAVNYLDKVDAVGPALEDVDVLYLSTNQQMTDPALRKGIFDFADTGRGMLLVHPALWYNWRDWPEYNRVLVGGGATSHDKYGEFEVTVTNPGHPVMAGVPKTFRITDELYHAKIDPAGTPVEVLATGKNLATGETYPLVWVVKHPKARIVCCTLGHDSKAHDLDAYKAILRNSAAWVSSREVASKK
jgi:putative heme-binding domain-containing protein